MCRFAHVFAALVIAACFLIGGGLSANDHFINLNIDAVAPDDIPALGINAGNPAERIRHGV